MTNIDRFRYLKASLSGIPKRMIANMEVNEQIYIAAWTALTKRYDNDSLIFRAHINLIISLQGVSGASPSKCRDLLDTVQSHYRSLESLGSGENIAENLIISFVLSKLDSYFLFIY